MFSKARAGWLPSLLALWCVARPAPLPAAERTTIDDAARAMGFPPSAASGSAILLCRPDTTLSLTQGSRQVTINGLLLHLNDAVTARNGDWTLARADADVVLKPIAQPWQSLADLSVRTIVLDPGHGGEDSGAVGRRRASEKRIVLDIARRVRHKLRDSGLAVVLTREEDEALELSERVSKARRAKADLFVSIHANSAGNGAAGIETYVLPATGFASTAGGWTNRSGQDGNDNDAANTLLGYFIQKGVLAQTEGTDRGVKRAGFQVLREAPCPAVLLECGFISNRREEEKLMQSLYRDHIAEGITQGILTYAGNCGQKKPEFQSAGVERP